MNQLYNYDILHQTGQPKLTELHLRGNNLRSFTQLPLKLRFLDLGDNPKLVPVLNSATLTVLYLDGTNAAL
jgi:hypothetical protein